VLVVGLGNPGKKYERNRHNVGFAVVDRLALKFGLPEFRVKFSGLWTRGDVELLGARHSVALLKPETFMNLSGDCVQAAAAFLKEPAAAIIVVHDELDLPFGEVRVKIAGGHGGHNGLRSIIGRLGTAEFARVRVGIGRPPPGFVGDVADYVLQNFDASEMLELPALVERACYAVELLVGRGPAAAMNASNSRAKR
jgi:PTH1 family peptidyl-tRNA hydrolase